MSWLFYALLSAVAAAATAILAKIGVGGIPSNLATAVRTSFIVPLVWALVVARGETHALKAASTQSLVFLALSALATGASWLAYFKALQLAPASHVAPRYDATSAPASFTRCCRSSSRGSSSRSSSGRAVAPSASGSRTAGTFRKRSR